MNPYRHFLALSLIAVLTGCGSEDAASPSTAKTTASASPTERGAVFPTATFADIREDPVSEEAAAEFQAILREAADGSGMTATVMTADGTWSGAVGTADGVREMDPDDQFSIGSVTKSVVAAQVMQLVDAGELALDDPASDHLPADLDFDTNEVTIRHLLGMRSGIPDFVGALRGSFSTNRQHRWTPTDVLGLVAADRSPAGERFQYSSTNYVLLGLIIEQVRGRPLADVLRDGVLDMSGVERLIYQPGEAPTEPMAMPGGKSTAALRRGRGYLPSLAGATAAGPAGAMASDAPSLARWWHGFCAGEIVSRALLTQMATFHDEYGLGLSDDTGIFFTPSVGHGGRHDGYVAYAGCLLEDGSVVVVLSNREDLEITEIADSLADAARSD